MGPFRPGQVWSSVEIWKEIGRWMKSYFFMIIRRIRRIRRLKPPIQKAAVVESSGRSISWPLDNNGWFVAIDPVPAVESKCNDTVRKFAHRSGYSLHSPLRRLHSPKCFPVRHRAPASQSGLPNLPSIAQQHAKTSQVYREYWRGNQGYVETNHDLSVQYRVATKTPWFTNQGDSLANIF